MHDINFIEDFCVTLLAVSNICNVYACFSERNCLSVQMGHLEGKGSNRKCLKPSRTWLKSSGIFPGWRWTICWTSNKILADEHSTFQMWMLSDTNSHCALLGESWQNKEADTDVWKCFQLNNCYHKLWIWG